VKRVPRKAARSAWLAAAVVACALTTLLPRGARAADSVAHVAAALYVPKVTAEGVEWDARWVLAAADAAAVHDDDTLVIRFARPLPEGETLWLETSAPALERIPTIRGVYENGRMVAVRVPGSLVDGRSVHATLVQRPLPKSTTWLVGAPIGEGTAAQIIDGSLGASSRLELDDGRFESHVGHQTSRRLSHAAREEARRLTGYDTRLSGAAIFVSGEDLRSGDLVARVVSPRERARHGYLALLGVFGAIVAALVWMLRRLRHAASVERADALLAAEIGRIEGEG
jgi:hypothetical protein